MFWCIHERQQTFVSLGIRVPTCVCVGGGGVRVCMCVRRVCVRQSVGARACVCTCVGEAFIKTLLLDSFLFSGGDCLCFSTLFLKLKSSISAF